MSESARTNRPLVLATLVMSMFMGSIEGTIVATAMPDIVGSLGGFSYYSWVFSSYLLMQAVATPIFGRLSDLYGRKPVFFAGTGIFLLGSLLCGLAPSMVWLIVFRFIQGLGAGGIAPITMTIIGDIYDVEGRARIQGWLSSVWGVSSIVGPLVGGIIVENTHWAWIFWLNLPFGLLAMLGLKLFLHEEVERRRRSIDWLGAFLFFVAVSSTLMVLVQGGVAWAWNSPQLLGLAALALVCLALFLWQQTRAPEPIMPLSLWRQRLIATANTVTLIAGMVLIGLTTFLPTFVQGVMGQGAVVAGFTLTAMSVGWPIAATVAGRLLTRVGNRWLTVSGALLLAAGALVLMLLDAGSQPLHAGVGSFLVGSGMGVINTSSVVAIQSTVPWKERGMATSSNVFTRILGSALGAAVFGSILNTVILARLTRQGMPVSLDEIRHLLDSGVSAVQADPVLQDALFEGLSAVYGGVFAAGILALFVTLLLPEVIKRRQPQAGALR